MSKLLKRLNDNQNKVTDTNSIMKLQAWDDGVAQDLTNKQITATIANAGGFLFDLDLVSNGTEIDLDFKDSQLQKLTPDTYFLEIKVTDEDGDVSVFPTEGYATFTINKNLHATEGALVPQITFDTVLADVKTAVDEKVAEYVKTIAKGDKGDTGPAGKDAEMPVIGGRNYILNSKRTLSTQDPNANHNGPSLWDTNWVDTSIPISQFSNKILTVSVQADYDNLTSVNAGARVGIEIVANEIKPDGTKTKRYLGTWHYVSEGESFHGRFSTTFDLSGITLESIYTPNHWAQGLYINGINDTNDLSVSVSNPKMEEGNVATDWTPAPEDIDSAIAKAPKLNGNNMYVGDNTYMGTNTFMDGVSLNGKNVVNGLTDTDWLDIPLAEGRTGIAKYKVSLGKVFVHLDGVKGVTGLSNSNEGRIGTLPVNPSPYYTRYVAVASGTVRLITITPDGTIYVSSAMGNTMSQNDPYLLDLVLM